MTHNSSRIFAQEITMEKWSQLIFAGKNAFKLPFPSKARGCGTLAQSNHSLNQSNASQFLFPFKKLSIGFNSF
jgi:hypothetical protein